MDTADRCYYNPTTKDAAGVIRLDRRRRCRKLVAETLTTQHPGESGGLLVGVCADHVALYLAHGWHRQVPR